MSGFLPHGYYPLAQVRDIMRENGGELGAFLAAGAMIACVREQDGSMVDVNTRIWASDDAEAYLANAELPAMQGSGPFPLFVRSQDIDDLARIMAARRRPKAPQAATVAPVVLKDVGGAPRVYDWEAAILELVRHVESGGDMTTTAALTRHLQAWFLSTAGREPSESEIKKRARKFREAMGAGT